MKLICKKCIIRDFRPDDAEAVAKYANNRKIWLQLRDAFPHPYWIEDAREFISRVTAQTPRTVFAIATEEEVIGAVGMGIGEDIHRHTAELGYWLAEPYWGKGIMTDVVRRFSTFAFREFDLYRIFAEPYANNPASAAKAVCGHMPIKMAKFLTCCSMRARSMTTT